MMKNRGISMIELVIVIIIIIMIAIFSIFSTKNTTLQAEAMLLYTEMKSVKMGVRAISQDYNYSIIEDIEEGKHYNEPYTEEDWYYIYGMENDEYSENVIKNLNLDELKRTYIVNFTTGEIKLEEPVTIGEYKIETYEDINTIVESGAI